MSSVQDNRPPAALLAVVNPVLRAVVPSRAGRLLPFPVAVLRFTGRRSGRALRIVANVHDVDGTPTVFTSRPWRLNFEGGREVEVAMKGRTRRGTGTLVADPEQVATALNHVFAAGSKPRDLGLSMPAGHVVTAADARAVGRELIRFAF